MTDGLVLTLAQVRQTAATIEAMQEPSGAVPWKRCWNAVVLEGGEGPPFHVLRPTGSKATG